MMKTSSVHAISIPDETIVQYMPLVRRVAGRLAGVLGPPADVEDLVSHGVFGLVDALEKYDPTMGCEFSTYARPRIRGAILDELRKIDWVPRTVRRKAKAVERAVGTLQHALRRTPDTEEVIAELRCTRQQFDRTQAEISLAAISHRSNDHVVLRLGSAVEDPGELYEDQEAKEVVAEAISKLQPVDRDIVVKYFYQGRTLASIGADYLVGESRICQIMRRIRETLAKDPTLQALVGVA